MEQKLAKLQAKIKEDNGFGEKLFSLENSEEAQSYLKDNGIDFSLDEIAQLKDALIKAVGKQQGGELSDEDLENVAGGSIGSSIDSIIDGISNFITVGGRRW
ncbi:MAG: Nif11-like leader peptide family RiPP precursor [Syntrophomonadaceae bacterium]|nr:Nif11-like leader peptide family RiPP precursor [Syntrophomonadaceae bacterium]